VSTDVAGVPVPTYTLGDSVYLKLSVVNICDFDVIHDNRAECIWRTWEVFDVAMPPFAEFLGGCSIGGVTGILVPAASTLEDVQRVDFAVPRAEYRIEAVMGGESPDPIIGYFRVVW
jgi:hypothetical protein